MGIVVLDLLHGGDASQFYLPLFETSLHSEAQHAGNFCIIMLTAILISAVLLVWGVRNDVRALMLPWMVLWSILCLGQLVLGMSRQPGTLEESLGKFVLTPFGKKCCKDFLHDKNSLVVCTFFF